MVAVRRMWVRSIWLGATLAVGAISLPGAALAAPPAQIATCAACHGADGLGNQATGFPALAGLAAGYIERQLDDFKHGIRQNPIMSGVAGGLDATQGSAIAAYYAAMPVPAKPEPTPLPGGAGETLAVNGDWNHQLTGVPACNSCHGPYGIGVGTAFPRLAGQPKAYLAAQLEAWQKGSRTGDPLHLMHNVAGKLTAAQVDAVAAYYAALPANPAVLPEAAGAEGDK